MSGDALAQKILNLRIEEARFQGYSQGKRVVKQWSINAAKFDDDELDKEKEEE